MRAKGIDLYQRWQGNYSHKDFHDFIMIKVAEGRWRVEHERVWEQAKDVPIKIAYLYLRSGEDAERQADTLIGATEFASYQPDGYMVDFEKRNNVPSMQFGQIFRDTVNIIKQKTGKKVIKYSNPSVIQEWLLRYGQRWVLDDHDWVIAQYPFRNDAWDTPQARQFLVDVLEDNKWYPRLPAGFGSWLSHPGKGSWQYSADGNGKGAENGVDSSAVDLQVWNGTRQECFDYWNVISDNTNIPPIIQDEIHIDFEEIKGNYKVTVNIDLEKI